MAAVVEALQPSDPQSIPLCTGGITSDGSFCSNSIELSPATHLALEQGTEFELYLRVERSSNSTTAFLSIGGELHQVPKTIDWLGNLELIGFNVFAQVASEIPTLPPFGDDDTISWNGELRP